MNRRCFDADTADDEQNIETRGVEARKVGGTRRDTSLVTLLRTEKRRKLMLSSEPITENSPHRGLSVFLY